MASLASTPSLLFGDRGFVAFASLLSLAFHFLSLSPPVLSLNPFSPVFVPTSTNLSLSLSLFRLDTNGQSKLRHYEVPCTEVTSPRRPPFWPDQRHPPERNPHLESLREKRGQLPPPSLPPTTAANYPAL